MKKIPYILFVFIQLSCFAQTNKVTIEQYVQTYKMLAVQEMYRAKIPASITMAQALLESGCGNSELCKQSNNHFGIKCKTKWNGARVYHDDDTLQECFRAYDSVHLSYKDHSDFLLSQPRYGFLFSLEPNDYKGWSYGLKKAGYATNPQYAEQLIAYIEKYELYKLDYILPNEEIKSNIVSEFKENQRKEVNINETPGIIAKQGDTYQKIAVEYDMRMWQLEKYNDLPDDAECKAGDIIFLKPKRNKSITQTHTVAKGETMQMISQKYAVKLRKLYTRNLIEPGEEPETGEVINLNENRELKPKVYKTNFKSSFDEPFDYNKLFKDDTGFVNHEAMKQNTEVKVQPPIVKAELPVKKVDTTTIVKQTPKKIEVPVNTIKPIENKDTLITISLKQYEEYKKLKLADSLRKVKAKLSADEVKTTDKTKLKKHIVAAGETLYKISKQYEVDVEELKSLNKLESNELEIGQELTIPSKKASASNTKENNIKTINYVWKKEDKFYKVAKKYKIKRKDLIELNNDLDTTSLKTGQKIKVPKPKETDETNR